MLKSLRFGLTIGTFILSNEENKLIRHLVVIYQIDGNNTTNFTGDECEELERIYQKYFP